MLIIPCLLSLRKKYPYSELFWSAFSRIRTQYGETRSISPYSVGMRENTDQNNSEYRHFLGSGQGAVFLVEIIMNNSYHHKTWHIGDVNWTYILKMPIDILDYFTRELKSSALLLSKLGTKSCVRKEVSARA